MSTYKLGIHENALYELKEASDYYNQKKTGLGFEFEEEVFSLFNVVKRSPLMFPVKFAGMHEVVVKRFPFVINYEVIGKEIIILSVFHVKQHPSKKVKTKSK